MSAPDPFEAEYPKMRLRLECLKLARRQDKAGLNDKQSDKVMDRGRRYWVFVETGATEPYGDDADKIGSL